MTILDKSEFRELFEREREPIFRFLYRLTRNSSDADDLAQETFLVIWRKRAQFRGENRHGEAGSLAGWVRRTAYRVYLNSRAKSSRRAALAPVQPHGLDAHARNGQTPSCAADGALEHRESVEYLVARVHEAVDELPDGAREAFLLFRCEGWSCAQIAEATEVPLKTVESRIARATELLATRLRPYKSSVPTW